MYKLVFRHQSIDIIIFCRALISINISSDCDNTSHMKTNGDTRYCKYLCRLRYYFHYDPLTLLPVFSMYYMYSCCFASLLQDIYILRTKFLQIFCYFVRLWLLTCTLLIYFTYLSTYKPTYGCRPTYLPFQNSIQGNFYTCFIVVFCQGLVRTSYRFFRDSVPL